MSEIPSADSLPTNAAQWRQLIDELTERNRSQRNDALEQQLADFRIRAASCAADHQALPQGSLPGDSLFPATAMGELPELDAKQLDLRHLYSGIQHHGSLIVRGLLDKDKVERYRDGIDAALSDQQDQSNSGWFNPPEALLSHPRCKGREFVQQTGGMWAPDSPRMLFMLLEEYERLGLRDMLNEYFAEPAWLSIKKWVLRRVEPLQQDSDWHQDGAFMGAECSSVNLWIALTDCGGQQAAPGMDIIPTRLNHIVETGTGGAVFDWSVGDRTVNSLFSDTPPVKPEFRAGDAIFFDHFNLHRTSFDSAFVNPRYAIECWFLGPKNYPKGQVPLFW